MDFQELWSALNRIEKQRISGESIAMAEEEYFSKIYEVWQAKSKDGMDRIQSAVLEFACRGQTSTAKYFATMYLNPHNRKYLKK